jgi:hypothetical protein
MDGLASIDAPRCPSCLTTCTPAGSTERGSTVTVTHYVEKPHVGPDVRDILQQFARE